MVQTGAVVDSLPSQPQVILKSEPPPPKLLHPNLYHLSSDGGIVDYSELLTLYTHYVCKIHNSLKHQKFCQTLCGMHLNVACQFQLNMTHLVF